ncbi:CU044_5270 family protein [Actinomadura miaoliensis]|uniref:CU044_5270 family protein n=1 Tax=Actinomadura miaoliensis TaxID=430685 RepID=A0ABP7W1Z2_9ACTN
MDDMRDDTLLVAALLDEGGPSPRVTAAGRQGLLELTRTAGRTPAHQDEHQHERRAGRRAGRRNGWLRGRRPLGLGLGLVAAAAAAAVAVATVGQGDPGGPGDAPSAEESARMTLMAAADRVERQPQGRYWYNHQRVSLPLRALGRDGGYVVEERNETFEVIGRTKGDGHTFYGRDIAARPQTRADEAAWRAAGSPSSWKVESSGVTRTLTSSNERWVKDDDGKGGTFNIGGIGWYTYEELQNLPTDPRALRKELCEGTIKHEPGVAEQLKERGVTRSPKKGGCATPAQALGLVFSVLRDTPVPPKVRAALMRLATDLPGVTRLPRATDPLGRTAVGLAADLSADPTGEVTREEVLFAPGTGQLLGARSVLVKPGRNDERWQTPGRTTHYWAIVASGWTDTMPKPPAAVR